MGRKANTPEMVWKFVDVRAPHECWPWKAAKQKGYGVFSIKHENYRVVRIICWLRDPASIDLRAEGSPSDRRIVIHSCDNPSCCNPNHLSVGSHKENTQDMIRKGRRADFHGENGQRAKLTNEDAERIREAHLFGAVQKDQANIYGISGATISCVVNGTIYKRAA